MQIFCMPYQGETLDQHLWLKGNTSALSDDFIDFSIALMM